MAQERRPDGDTRAARLRSVVVLAGFLVIAGYFLWTEHQARVMVALPYLPWLLLLACPFLHFFMHRGHGGHGKGDGTDAKDRSISDD